MSILCILAVYAAGVALARVYIYGVVRSVRLFKYWRVNVVEKGRRGEERVIGLKMRFVVYGR